MPGTWRLPPDAECVHSAARFRSSYTPSQHLGIAIWLTEWRGALIAAWLGVGAVACSAAVPVLLYTLLTRSMSATDGTGVPLSELMELLVLIYSAVLLGQLMKCHSDARMFAAQTRVVAALRALIFEVSIHRAVRNGFHRPSANVSAIVSMYSSNLFQVAWLIAHFHHLWMALVTLALQLVILNRMLHVSAVVLAASLGAFCAIMMALAMLETKATQRNHKKRGKMLNAVNDAFRGIHAIKLNAWEDKIEAQILARRAKEEARRFTWGIVRVVRHCVSWDAPMLVSIPVFYQLSLQNTQFSPATVFTALVLFHHIKIEAFQLVHACRFFVEGKNGLRKISRYLKMCEVSAKAPIDRQVREGESDDPLLLVAIENAVVTDSIGGKEVLLVDINVQVRRGELVVVHGHAGAGKSTLLQTLLGEVMRVRGRVYVAEHCSIAYCAEEVWLQTLSVRDNILFGSPYHRERYLSVLDACGLLEDLATLPDGEDTQIGPKGINLSGGQKSRIALARACYADADLYILDTTLASVDAVVQSQVFRRCLLELLRHKTIIFATHNPEVISSEFVDRLWKVEGMTVHETNRPADSAWGAGGQSIRARRMAELPPWKRSTSPQPVNDGELILSYPDVQVRGKCPPMKSTKSIVSLKEDPSTMAVDWRALLKMLQDSGGWAAFTMSVCLLAMYGFVGVAMNLWLLYWSEQSPDTIRDRMKWHALVYGGLTSAGVVLSLCSVLCLRHALLKTSNMYFALMTRSLLRTSMAFFYATPVGEILSRYSTDMQVFDSFVLFPLDTFGRTALAIGTALGVSCYFMSWSGLAVALVLLFIAYDTLSMRRLGGTLASHYTRDATNLNLMAEAFDGGSTIRAFGQTQLTRFYVEHHKSLDESHVHGVLLVLSAILVHFGRLPPSVLGLLLHYMLGLHRVLKTLCANMLKMSLHRLAVARVIAYSQLPPEDSDTVDCVPLPNKWPAHGKIEFEHVFFRYAQVKDAPWTLNDVNVVIRGGERVGVVGRTGSGKTSLAMALLRIHTLVQGRILIDGIDVSRIPLAQLRTAIRIIPQNPMLYLCRVREYLDPFNEISDDAMWSVIQKVGLCRSVDSLEHDSACSERPRVASLDTPLYCDGENWSLGERQLLALARAMLRPRRIVILDEAFSSLHQEQDSQLQAVVERAFAGSTIFLITHRIDQVLDLDRVLVFDHGKLIENGPAATLVADPGSAFYEFLETSLLTY
ncbi:TPA: hypothetical protein N0F65_002961 [Lagenidium giganteum]|uniref:Uncharacterized protein n=1 Tax=Lagenidium giganteum TaxID=4803 RepID=A0AAV2YP72_9STRA|nr:TPA: hypothetical protein N0F65_002961 [Lagenidium giganteum]